MKKIKIKLIYIKILSIIVLIVTLLRSIPEINAYFDNSLFFITDILFLPSLILLFMIRDFEKSLLQKKSLNFSKLLLKGIIVSFIFTAIVVLFGLFNCKGLACLAIYWSPVFFLIGVFASFIIAIGLYFESKRALQSTK